MLVSFNKTRDGLGIMGKVLGRVCFPDSRWPYDPNALIDIWGAPLDCVVDVVITGENPSKSVYFVAPKAQFVRFFHYGFECSGSMCCTTASGKMVLSDGSLDNRSHMITPGRFNGGSLLHVADNVNTSFRGLPKEQLKPGYAYCEKLPLKHWRVVGIDPEEDLYA